MLQHCPILFKRLRFAPLWPVRWLGSRPSTSYSTPSSLSCLWPRFWFELRVRHVSLEVSCLCVPPLLRPGRLRSVGFLASLFHWEVSLRVAPRWLSPVRRIPALPLQTGGISCSSSWYHPLCAAPRRIILQPLLCQETPGAHLCIWRQTNFLPDLNKHFKLSPVRASTWDFLPL